LNPTVLSTQKIPKLKHQITNKPFAIWYLVLGIFIIIILIATNLLKYVNNIPKWLTLASLGT